MRELQRLANERQLAEELHARQYEAAIATAKANFKQQTTEAQQRYQSAKTASEQAHTDRMDALSGNYESTRNRTQAEYRRIREEVDRKYESTVRETKENKKQAVWQALAVFDAAKNNPRETLEAFQEELSLRRRELDQLDLDGIEILKNRRLWRSELANSPQADAEPAAEVVRPADADAARAAIARHVAAARQRVETLNAHRLSRVFEDFTPFVVVAGCWLVLLVTLGLATNWSHLGVWFGGSLAATLLVCGVGGWLLHRKHSAWAVAEYRHLHAQAATGRGLVELAAVVARNQSRREAEQLIATRDRELAEAEAAAVQALEEIEHWKQSTLANANATFPAQLTELRASHQTATVAESGNQRATLTTLTANVEAEKRAAEVAKHEAVESAQTQQASAWQAMREAWMDGFAAVRTELEQMSAVCQRLFPDWNTTDYARWLKPEVATEAVQFGEATLELAKVKHALSADHSLRPDVTTLAIPALLTLREQPSMVISADGEARAAAVDLLQTMMVRFLTAMPPGKVRFTICDPVSLGENFSSFMHLADHDEGLINGRIWSESRDLDEQLARLTGHMETVLQKYLRNEYNSIHEYNAQAGEVAEPFQVLSIANFPHGFTDTSARRLLSLVTGGPRCGIYVLLSHDCRQRLPNDFVLDDLLAPSVHLEWDAERERFVWRYPAFEQLPLRLPDRLENEALVRLIKQAGKEAKDSIRVEVPFQVVAPEQDTRWSQTCDRELTIPIGRAGANRLQYVRLGKGTAQHLLVAGKTGSGKSTFLHALVTSGALHFSPDELQFYLVDFKKGVEFKSYATHSLPHAEVIAIESEREFGLSVLERLDQELRRRGELFREAGVQSLADYRGGHPGESMPRILLVIDEFQELFVEDDKPAQEAGLLLDRLVRQGRAFGMHVLLGSQTLSGAYSLARSTLGQMAVRVALQCSESDAHLILSDERNQAARFLSRPGEAIYNDQNGLASANEPFQVVWLPDRERANLLEEVDQLRRHRGMDEHHPIVFEGNAPADPSENVELMDKLRGVLAADPEQEADGDAKPAIRLAHSATAWLGSAVAIKPPTSVTFAPHGGSNLLIVGQQPAAALGVMSTGVVSLAASNSAATFAVLDGSREGDAGEGIWPAVVDALGDRASLIDRRDVPATIHRIATELARRDEQNDESAAPIYLVIHNASRFRDLRKGEDDFSFSLDADKPPAPDKQLAEILKNGPQWNLHTMVWCDGYNAVTRLFDRLAMREFEMRVAFQMSAADSSNLLDTPAASKLSPHRALLYNDETGEAEKFRPYGLPTPEWIAVVAASLAERPAVDQV